jgi:hypothetical protein
MEETPGRKEAAAMTSRTILIWAGIASAWPLHVHAAETCINLKPETHVFNGKDGKTLGLSVRSGPTFELYATAIADCALGGDDVNLPANGKLCDGDKVLVAKKMCSVSAVKYEVTDVASARGVIKSVQRAEGAELTPPDISTLADKTLLFLRVEIEYDGIDVHKVDRDRVCLTNAPKGCAHVSATPKPLNRLAMIYVVPRAQMDFTVDIGNGKSISFKAPLEIGKSLRSDLY